MVFTSSNEINCKRGLSVEFVIKLHQDISIKNGYYQVVYIHQSTSAFSKSSVEKHASFEQRMRLRNEQIMVLSLNDVSYYILHESACTYIHAASNLLGLGLALNENPSLLVCMCC